VAADRKWPGQVRVVAVDPWTEKEISQLKETLDDAEVAISPSRRVLAIRFAFDWTAEGSLSVEACRRVEKAIIGIKFATDPAEFLDGSILRAWD